jgi:uncharacterized membrane protein
MTLAYWFHMLATVVWVGGLSTLALLILPAADSKLGQGAEAAGAEAAGVDAAGAFSTQLEGIQSRLDRLGWFCLALLVGTGLVQMSGNPNYEGLLEFGNRWSAAILLKHIVFGGMVVVSAYLTWGVIPRLRRAVLFRSKMPQGRVGEDLAPILRTNRRLVYLNLFLGVIVLAFTAIARALN